MVVSKSVVSEPFDRARDSNDWDNLRSVRGKEPSLTFNPPVEMVHLAIMNQDSGSQIKLVEVEAFGK